MPLIVLAGLAAISFIWLAQMNSSLWIDELGTFWVIDGDLSSTAGRAWRFQGQTPVYYALVWGVTQVLGTSEIVLRLPSLLSMLAAAFLLYRFSMRLFGRTTAIVTLAVFVVYPNVDLYATDARPYALALMATLVATMLLESWLRTTDPKHAAWYGLAAAGVVYAHYVFATIFVAHALFIAWVISQTEPAQRRRLWTGSGWAASIFLLAIAPTFPQITNLIERSNELVFLGKAPPWSLIEIWAPPVAAVALIGVIALAAIRGGRLRRLPKDPLILLGLGFVTPPLVLFMLSLVSDLVLWTPRYWFVIAPYGAMLFGVLITSNLPSARSLKIATLAILLVGILAGTSIEHSSEDWRSAASLANSITDPDTTVLLYTGLIELTSPDFLLDPEKKSYVTSPLAYYPVEGNVTPLPRTSLRDYTDRIPPQLAEGDHKPIVVIVNYAFGSSQLWFMSGWLSANGYQMTTDAAFGAVRLAAFTPP